MAPVSLGLVTIRNVEAGQRLRIPVIKSYKYLRLKGSFRGSRGLTTLIKGSRERV
jgi:hypothetical protein